jgi:hypothetical protein
VVEAKPGLRDYRKRLAGREATNPFKQHYAGAQTENAELSGGSSSDQTTTVTTGGSVGSPTAEAAPAPSSTSAPGSAGKSGDLVFYTWAIDAYIHKVPKDPEVDDEAITRPRVLAQTPLPAAGSPVVTFMGLSRQAAEKNNVPRALFTVSDEVTRVVEGGKCLARGEGACELIEADEGEAITFLYGPGETRYTIKVLKLELVVTGHS